MKKLTTLEHAAAALAAVLITCVSVSAVAGLGYPAPAGGVVELACSRSTIGTWKPQCLVDFLRGAEARRPSARA
jgi:hypothetical protein